MVKKRDEPIKKRTTLREQAETALHTLNTRLDFLLSSSPAIIYTCEPVPPYAPTFVSTNLTTILGYTVKEFLATPSFWADHIHPDDRDRVFAKIPRLFAQGTLLHEYRFQHQDGSWRWMSDALSVVPGPDGKTRELIGYFIDITERKQAEEALRKRETRLRALNINLEHVVAERTGTLRASEERYRYWMLTMPGAVYEFCLDAAGHRSLRFISSGITDLTGLSPAEAMADVEVVFQRIPPDALPAMDESIRHSMETLSPWLYEFPFRVTTGELKWIRGHAVPRREQDGGTCWTGVLVDITDHKQAEESLAASKKRLQDILDSLFGFVALYTLDGRIVEINRAPLELGRVSKTDVVGRYFWETPWWADLPEMQAQLQDWMSRAAHGELVRGELVFRVPGDHLATAEATFGPLRDAAGAIINVVGFGVDITERKWAEEALAQSERLFRTLAEVSPVGIFRTDATGGGVYVNERACNILGMSADTATAEGWMAALHPDDRDRVIEEWAQAVRSQRPFMSEYRLRTPDQTITWVIGQARAEFDQHGDLVGYVGTLTDITNRKRMEDALRQQQQELRAAIKERERISHDLHDGILQSLFAVGLSLEASKSTLSPRSRTTTGPPLEQAIDQLNCVMNEVRNFITGLSSDLLQGKDLKTALRQMLDSLTAHQVTQVRLAVEDRAVQAVSAEQALHLLLVVQEAVSNGLWHGRAQVITVSLKMLKQGIRLSIRDNGRGFTPKAAKGIGHGLSNMAARAQMLRGRLTVVSKRKEGTRIFLDVPNNALPVHH